MRIAFASLLATTVLFTIATGQQFGFANFPLNLALPSYASLTLTWEGQDGYVNMTLSQFYYFGGGDVFKDIITTFNSESSLVWTPDASLQQGIYGFFVASPNRNSSESPFFSLLTSNISSAAPPSSSTPPLVRSSGLSETARVGLGVGLPLGLIIIACLGFIFWRERSSRFGRDVAAPLPHGQPPLEMQAQQMAELESKRPIHELRAERQS